MNLPEKASIPSQNAPSWDTPESIPSTKQSWEEPEQVPPPKSAPTESGVRPIWRPESKAIQPDIGANDRTGEPVSGDRLKPPFVPSVKETEESDEQAAA